MNFFRRKKKPAELMAVAKVDPTTLEAFTHEEFLHRGLAFHAIGNNEKAEADLRQAVTLNGDSVDAHFNLGLVYKIQGQNAAAAASFIVASEKLSILEETDPVRALLVGKLLKWHIRQLKEGK